MSETEDVYADDERDFDRRLVDAVIRAGRTRGEFRLTKDDFLWLMRELGADERLYDYTWGAGIDEPVTLWGIPIVWA